MLSDERDLTRELDDAEEIVTGGKPGRDELGDHVDRALAAIGGEDTEFYLTARRDGGEGRRIPVVLLSCRYQGCDWGETVGEMELWEFVTDARRHWETSHASAPSAPVPPEGNP